MKIDTLAVAKMRRFEVYFYFRQVQLTNNVRPPELASSLFNAPTMVIELQ